MDSMFNFLTPLYGLWWYEPVHVSHDRPCSIEALTSCSVYYILQRKVFYEKWRNPFQKILNPWFSMTLIRKMQKVTISKNGGTNATISREGLIERSWNFLHTYILVSYSLTKIFTITRWAVRVLWISKFRQKSTFSTTLEIHNFWLERGNDLKSLL